MNYAATTRELLLRALSSPDNRARCNWWRVVVQRWFWPLYVMLPLQYPYPSGLSFKFHPCSPWSQKEISPLACRSISVFSLESREPRMFRKQLAPLSQFLFSPSTLLAYFICTSKTVSTKCSYAHDGGLFSFSSQHFARNYHEMAFISKWVIMVFHSRMLCSEE